MVWVTTLTPMVFAGTQVRVYFDPNGSLLFAVSPLSYNFTSVLAGTSKLTTGGNTWGTMYNNGTVKLNVTIYTNVTSDAPSRMVCENGGAPAADHYALNSSGLTINTYFPTAIGANVYSQILGGLNQKFGLRVTIGATLLKNWSYQRTTINFTATQAT